MRRRLAVLIATVVATTVFLVPEAQAETGNFHVTCLFSHASQDDPIVFPRVSAATHRHDFYGNTSTNAFSRFAELKAASTRCDERADRSGYWAPSLIAPNGAVVTPVRVAVYYLQRLPTAIAPPPDLRVVAGGDTRIEKTAGYNCSGGGAITSAVPLDCGTGYLKGVIIFPSCWDGVNTDSADHRSHLAYATGKGCPSTHRVAIPKIVFHITYGIRDGTGYGLSSDAKAGMTNGMSLHADFWNAWKSSRLRQLVTTCVNAGVTC